MRGSIGVVPFCPKISSNSFALESSRPSARGRAAICKPTGKFSRVNPHGNDKAVQFIVEKAQLMTNHHVQSVSSTQIRAALLAPARQHRGVDAFTSHQRTELGGLRAPSSLGQYPALLGEQGALEILWRQSPRYSRRPWHASLSCSYHSTAVPPRYPPIGVLCSGIHRRQTRITGLDEPSETIRILCFGRRVAQQPAYHRVDRDIGTLKDLAVSVPPPWPSPVSHRASSPSS